MRLGTTLLALVAASFLVAGTGCSNKVAAERDTLLNQNRELQERLKAEGEARQLAESRATAMTTQLTPIAETPATPDMGPLDLTGPRGPRAGTPVRVSTPRPEAPAKVTIPGKVLFDSGKTTLTSSATKTLDTVASTILSKYKGDKLVIEGYTDSTPPSKNSVWKSNEDLAEARATAVKKYLVKKGVPAANITVKAVGATAGSKDLAQNRRVEVAVLTN